MARRNSVAIPWLYRGVGGSVLVLVEAQVAGKVELWSWNATSWALCRKLHVSKYQTSFLPSTSTVTSHILRILHPPPRPLASPCFDYTAVLHSRTTHLHPILPDCQPHPPWVSSRAAFCAWCKHYYMPSASPAPALPSVCANLSRHANIHT